MKIQVRGANRLLSFIYEYLYCNYFFILLVEKILSRWSASLDTNPSVFGFLNKFYMGHMHALIINSFMEMKMRNYQRPMSLHHHIWTKLYMPTTSMRMSANISSVLKCLARVRAEWGQKNRICVKAICRSIQFVSFWDHFYVPAKSSWASFSRIGSVYYSFFFFG